ncbi:MAG: hypothetical protein EOM21_14165 [Gammaproteobacteria bacterium]|nr:hypothetical protein [Gammaproteobacteria bacterium]
MTREEVLSHIMQRAGIWTTHDLADEIGCKEYRVRAVVAWLCIGGHVRIADTVTRRDVSGRPYQAQAYAWTGRTAPVSRVVRDRERRRENWAPRPATAQEWLSRAWV